MMHALIKLDLSIMIMNRQIDVNYQLNVFILGEGESEWVSREAG